MWTKHFELEEETEDADGDLQNEEMESVNK